MPDGIQGPKRTSVSLLAAVGFTMSLFIGTLAFVDPEHTAAVRLDVLSGSTLSAIAGYLVLRYAPVPAAERPLEFGSAANQTS